MTSLRGSADPEDLVLGAIDGSGRRNIQKATGSGVTVDLGDDGIEVPELPSCSNVGPEPYVADLSAGEIGRSG